MQGFTVGRTGSVLSCYAHWITHTHQHPPHNIFPPTTTSWSGDCYCRAIRIQQSDSCQGVQSITDSVARRAAKRFSCLKYHASEVNQKMDPPDGNCRNHHTIKQSRCMAQLKNAYLLLLHRHLKDLNVSGCASATSISMCTQCFAGEPPPTLWLTATIGTIWNLPFQTRALIALLANFTSIQKQLWRWINLLYNAYTVISTRFSPNYWEKEHMLYYFPNHFQQGDASSINGWLAVFSLSVLLLKVKGCCQNDPIKFCLSINAHIYPFLNNVPGTASLKWGSHLAKTRDFICHWKQVL